MRSRNWMTLGTAAVFLAAPLPQAEAQATGLREPPSTGRLMVDGYVSRFRLLLPDARTSLDGMGARVMWALAPTTGPQRSRLAEHLSVGAFASTTPADGIAGGADVRTAVHGAQIDVRPLRAPVAGVLEPVLSLGAGAMTVRRTRSAAYLLSGGTMLLPRDVPSVGLRPPSEHRSTRAMLAPAVGLLFAPRADFALRFDVRQIRARHERAVELATGVSLRP